MPYNSTTWSNDTNTDASLTSSTPLNVQLDGTLAVTAATTLSSTLAVTGISTLSGCSINLDSDSVLEQSTNGAGTSNTIFGKNPGT